MKDIIIIIYLFLSLFYEAWMLPLNLLGELH